MIFFSDNVNSIDRKLLILFLHLVLFYFIPFMPNVNKFKGRKCTKAFLYQRVLSDAFDPNGKY